MQRDQIALLEKGLDANSFLIAEIQARVRDSRSALEETLRRTSEAEIVSRRPVEQGMEWSVDYSSEFATEAEIAALKVREAALAKRYAADRVRVEQLKVDWENANFENQRLHEDLAVCLASSIIHSSI